MKYNYFNDHFGYLIFQYEGAVKEDGRGPTIWDTFSHSTGIILDGTNADVAVDQYHRYVEDIQLMKDMGMDAYRFSITWSRILPNGSGEINQAGLDHYNNLINALLAKGIVHHCLEKESDMRMCIQVEAFLWCYDEGTEPYVTLYHWDLPQALEDKYIGWLDRQIMIRSTEALLDGFCRVGNSSTEPYIVAHNVLLSHAAAADIYRKNYKVENLGYFGCSASLRTGNKQATSVVSHFLQRTMQDKQNGSIGISLDVKWFVPATNATENIEATQRAQDFQLWLDKIPCRFLDPLIIGDYPSSMRSRVGTRLPTFTESETALLKCSLDFVGINHYSTYYASENGTNPIGDLLNDVVSDANAYAIRTKLHFIT
ncbi:Beta-glucosidase 40 [Hibiscus syriacus]|uniref:Beta-glucosidase 40 n=1 Tax=Hibiscus syriacus TaxID=106335 RepID=A0A6A3CWY5_HIBSY|nr:Beta-glucosidase 40 [Hibiscus syriacus]